MVMINNLSVVLLCCPCVSGDVDVDGSEYQKTLSQWRGAIAMGCMQVYIYMHLHV